MTHIRTIEPVIVCLGAIALGATLLVLGTTAGRFGREVRLASHLTALRWRPRHFSCNDQIALGLVPQGSGRWARPGALATTARRGALPHCRHVEA